MANQFFYHNRSVQFISNIEIWAKNNYTWGFSPKVPVNIRSNSKRSQCKSLQPKDITLNWSLNQKSAMLNNFFNPVISKLKLIPYTNDNIRTWINAQFFHLKNKVVCRPEEKCHLVERNESLVWYSKRYFVPNVTKIRFQIKPHIFF